MAKSKRRTSTGSRKTGRPRTRQTVLVGEALAAEVLRFRRESLRRRVRALQRMPPRLKALASGVSPRLIRAAGGAGRRGVLVAKGDS